MNNDTDWKSRAEKAERELSAHVKVETCASCGLRKPTPYRRDDMGGYVCLTCVETRLNKAEACCAEMRVLVEDLKAWTRYNDPYSEKILHALSSDCGTGWLSPEKAKVLVEALEMCRSVVENEINVRNTFGRDTGAWPDVLTGCVSGGGIIKALATVKQ